MPSSLANTEIISRRYVAVLALAAVAILIIGVLLKPEKPTPEPPSPSETARLQRLLRAEELHRMAGYLAERALAAAPYVVWTAEQNSSGVKLRSGQVVTAALDSRGGAPLVAVATKDRSPAVKIGNPPTGENWTLVVARGVDGEPLWNAALYGGEKAGTCGTVRYRELAVNVPSSPAFAGAGVFDVEGNLIGVVGRCRDQHVTVAARDVRSVLRAADSIDSRIPDRFGFVAAPLTRVEAQFFELESGLLVRTVWQRSPAERAGLRPGDVIVSVNGGPAALVEHLGPLLADADPASLSVFRNGRATQITIGLPEDSLPDVAGLGLEPEAQTPPRATVTVHPDTPAYRAGLRTGDAIVRIGARSNPSSLEIRRLLTRANGAPTYVVYERDSRHTGVLLSK